jgi:hypothetical protein
VCALSVVAGDKADLFNCVELSNEGFGLVCRVFLCFYWMDQPNFSDVQARQGSR